MLVLPGAPVADGAAAPRVEEFVGGGPGIRVEFRLKGHELVKARIEANLGCVTHKRGHTWTHRVKVTEAWASGRWPLAVDARGRFREGFADQLEWIGEEAPGVARLNGQIGAHAVNGKFAIHGTGGNEPEAAHPWTETCQTGPLPPGQMRELSFRAHRR
jgi:hypothetical protein